MAAKGKKPRRTVVRRKPVMPTQEEIDARRERVRELWGKSDRLIARKLIQEGYFKPGPSRVETDRAKFEDSCRRNVTNDREAIRDAWKKRNKPTADDVTVFAEDYIARLRMRVDELDMLLEDPELKPTPRMLAHSEIRQLEALIAKAQGVEQMPDREPEGEGPAVPFIGLILDVTGVDRKVIGNGDDD